MTHKTRVKISLIYRYWNNDDDDDDHSVWLLNIIPFRAGHIEFGLLHVGLQAAHSLARLLSFAAAAAVASVGLRARARRLRWQQLHALSLLLAALINAVVV